MSFIIFLFIFFCDPLKIGEDKIITNNNHALYDVFFIV